MNPILSAFYTILYQPLFNALVLVYLYLPGHDFGLAVILLTLVIRTALYPLGVQAIRSQKTLAQLQPKMKEIQEKFKNNKEQQSRAMMELYQKEKINPFSGCLPMIVQLPILIGLYQVFWKGFGEAQMSFLYGVVPNPGLINTSFLGIMDLSQASIFLAVLTGAAQFFQSKMMTAKQVKSKGPTDMSQMMQKQMLYLFPIFTVFILWKLPAAVALYWLTTTLFTIVQQYIILKKNQA